MLLNAPEPASAFTASMASHVLDWSALRTVFYLVHTHVCGHSSFDDMQTLLQLTQHLYDKAEKYLLHVVTRGSAYKLVARPKPSHKAALFSLHLNF